jgi:TRAP-type C4-dicarboxylate transport system substrate-binding protein
LEQKQGGYQARDSKEQEGRGKTVNKKSFYVIALAMTICLVLVGCGTQTGEAPAQDDQEIEPVVWKIASAYGPGDQCWDIQMPMLKECIETVTKGMVIVEMYEPDSICSAGDMPTSVINGTLDGALSAPNDTCQIVEAAYCESGIPFYWGDKHDTYECLYSAGLADFLREEYRKAGLIYGGFAPSGNYSLQTTFSVQKASDFVGRKIRATGNYGEFTKQLGGSAVAMSGGDIYMALKLGTIEGTFFGLADIDGMGWKEVVNYCVPCVSAGAPCNFIFNIGSWGSLPEDIQSDLKIALEELFLDLFAESEKLETAAILASKECGVVFQDIPEENLPEFQQAASKMAEILAEKYPASAKGFQIIEEWKASK